MYLLNKVLVTLLGLFGAPMVIQGVVLPLPPLCFTPAPGQSTTSCLQLFGIFIVMQRSCFKQMIVS